MKIAMIGQKGLPAHSGGVERHVEDLVTRLTSAGHEVVVYCRKSYMKEGVYTRFAGAKLIVIPTLPSKHFETVIQTFLASLHVLTLKADIIHYHGIGPSLFAWIPRLLNTKARILATFHCQDYYHQKWGILARLVFRLGEVVACTMTHQTIVVSKLLKQYVKRKYGREAIYIPNAVPLREKIPINSIKSAFGLTAGSYFLCVARLVRHKGIHTVIDAYNKTAGTNLSSPKLVIVGAPAHTNDYMTELAVHACGNPNILFIGEQSGSVLAELYSNARLFIQASESEGLSYALLEAMSYGCPILVSDIPEHREVLISGENTFETRNAEHLAEKLTHYLAPHSQQDLEAHALSHKEHVRTHYDLSQAFKKMSNVYACQWERARVGQGAEVRL